jgi:hypothetical protein
MTDRSLKRDRIKACELAAICMQGNCGPEKAIAGRLMSLTVFFETYIAEGCDATEAKMRLLTRGVRGARRKQWQVIAGGALNG